MNTLGKQIVQQTILLALLVLTLFILPLIVGSEPYHVSASPAPLGSAQAPGICGPMDVAFIIDNTASMGSAIDNVKAELAGILNTIETSSGNDYRLALVTFKDDITVEENFAATNAASIEPKILALSASGGGGAPEASDEALNTVVNALLAAGRPQNMDFTPSHRPAALKIAILVTDAPPGGFDDIYTPGVDDVRAHRVAFQAGNQSIRISAILVPTPTAKHFSHRTIMQDYTATTNGVFIESAADGTGTGAAINDIIASCGGGVLDKEDEDDKGDKEDDKGDKDDEDDKGDKDK
jgi:hypothetical protein